MALPMVFGITTVMLFGLVDTFFIGLLGTHELAAISFTFPVSFIVMNLMMGLGIGTSVVLSRLLGAGKHHEATRVTSDGLLLALLITCFITGIGLATITPLFTLLGADQHTLPHIHDYMQLWYIGAVFLVIPMVGNSAIRATGDTRTPSLIMILAGILNGILDPLLIFGIGPFPEMGMQGAALASVLAWMVSFIVACWVLAKRKKLLSLTLPTVTELIASWRPILRIGLPSSLSNMLIPLAAGVMTAIIARSGPEAVAAFGVGSRIEAFALVIVMAMSAALPPFLGQNLGAGNIERAKQAITISLRFALIMQAGIYLLLAGSGSWLGSLFSDNSEVISLIGLFMLILPASYGFQAIIILGNSALYIMHRPMEALALNVLRLFILYIPGAWLGHELFGLVGLFIGGTLGSILAGLLAWPLIKRRTDTL